MSAVHDPDLPDALEAGNARPMIRRIRAADDPAMAAIIRSVLESFGCVGEGYAYGDPEVAAMSRAYRDPGSEYYVVEVRGEVLGGGGFAQLDGTSPTEATCELRKMYFDPRLRGQGMGRRLLRHILGQMRAAGYQKAYLETTQDMVIARKLYESLGFQRIGHSLGKTGHHGCELRYLLSLTPPGS